MRALEDQNLLELIKKNEKRSKIRMVIAILVSLILAVLTLFYAHELKESQALAEAAEAQTAKLKTDYEESRENLIAVNDSLRALLKKWKSQGSDYTDEINVILDKSEKTGYLIYMHDKTSKGRKKSSQIRRKLEKAGFKVAGIERMKDDFQSSVRYFHKGDVQAAKEAQRIIASAFDSNSGMRNLDLVPLFHLKAPRKSLEVWLEI